MAAAPRGEAASSSGTCAMNQGLHPAALAADAAVCASPSAAACTQPIRSWKQEVFKYVEPQGHFGAIGLHDALCHGLQATTESRLDDTDEQGIGRF